MYDISDLSDPELLATLTIDGDVLDARLVGTQVRVATVSSPDVDAPSPTYTRTGRISATSKAELRAAIARTTVDDWVPTYTLRDGAGAPVSRGRLVECADLARPETFSGLDTVAVSSFDMGSALQSRQTVGVVAGGQQIYATDASTYVSTTDWNPEGFTAKTTLHKFVTAPSGASSYQGSGEVPGTLLNQYAMSEYQGRPAGREHGLGTPGLGQPPAGDRGRWSRPCRSRTAPFASWVRSAGSVGRTTSRSTRCGSSRSAATS